MSITSLGDIAHLKEACMGILYPNSLNFLAISCGKFEQLHY